MYIVVQLVTSFILSQYRIAQAFPEGEKTRVWIFHGIEGEQYGWF